MSRIPRYLVQSTPYVPPTAPDGSPSPEGDMAHATPWIIPGVYQEPPAAETRYLNEKKKQTDEACARLLDDARAEAQLIIAEAKNRAQAIMDKAQGEGEQALADAQQHAEGLMKDAEDRWEETLKGAFESGYDDGVKQGRSDGLNQAATEAADILTRVQALAEHAHEAELRVLKSFRRDAAKLMSVILEEMVGEKLAQHPEETWFALINKALDRLHASGTIKIAAHAETLQKLKAFHPKTNDAVEGMTRFEFVLDPHLQPDELYILGREWEYNIAPKVQIAQSIQSIEKHLPVTEPEGLPPLATNTEGLPTSPPKTGPPPPVAPMAAAVEIEPAAEIDFEEAVTEEDIISQEPVGSVLEEPPQLPDALEVIETKAPTPAPVLPPEAPVVQGPPPPTDGAKDLAKAIAAANAQSLSDSALVLPDGVDSNKTGPVLDEGPLDEMPEEILPSALEADLEFEMEMEPDIVPEEDLEEVPANLPLDLSLFEGTPEDGDVDAASLFGLGDDTGDEFSYNLDDLPQDNPYEETPDK